MREDASCPPYQRALPMNGKGSNRRPSDVPPGTFEANYERTFGEPASRMPERFPPPTISADDLIVIANPPEPDALDG